jgi:hypothetical protein
MRTDDPELPNNVRESTFSVMSLVRFDRVTSHPLILLPRPLYRHGYRSRALNVL